MGVGEMRCAPVQIRPSLVHANRSWANAERAPALAACLVVDAPAERERTSGMTIGCAEWSRRLAGSSNGTTSAGRAAHARRELSARRVAPSSRGGVNGFRGWPR
jgi:hypothetical protein